MNVTIIGGAGFIGRKVAEKLAAKGQLRGQTITSLTLADVSMPDPVDAPFPVETRTCDITSDASVNELITTETDVIFHFAAVVSSHAEADFQAGMKVNLDGTLHLLERCRTLGNCPVVVFTSSLAVFGGDVPDPITDHTIPNPQTSYGMQKAVGELLINDYSRRGYIDGRGFRLPTISVRPGKPNRAASSFMSSIIREPLNGEPAVCPVDEDQEHFYLSPRRCVENLIKGAEVPAADLGQQRCMIMPGQRLSIRQMIDALKAVAGAEPVKLITWEDQPDIARIVRGWRYDYRFDKALALGLEADKSFEENIRYYMEDDLPAA